MDISRGLLMCAVVIVGPGMPLMVPLGVILRQSMHRLLLFSPGAFSSIEEIPENVVHDHEKNGLPRLSSFSKIGIQKR